MKLTLSIERLVLDGLAVTPDEAARIRDAAEAELLRLLAAEGVPARLRSAGASPAVPAPPLTIASGAAPEAIGAQIARSVHSVLGERQ
jgi:hypothetical protein